MLQDNPLRTIYFFLAVHFVLLHHAEYMHEITTVRLSVEHRRSIEGIASSTGLRPGEIIRQSLTLGLPRLDVMLRPLGNRRSVVRPPVAPGQSRI